MDCAILRTTTGFCENLLICAVEYGRIFSRRHFSFNITKFYYLLLFKTVVLTRKQLEKLSKKELIDELITVNSIHEDLANLTSRFDEFLEKYTQVKSELEVSKYCTKHLSKQIQTLQRNALGSLHYLRREMIEINLVPEDIQGTQLEESICQALSLTGNPVSAGDLEACHRMRRRDWVIVKLSRKKKEKYFLKRKVKMGNLMSSKTWDLRQRNYLLVTRCVMRITSFSVDAGS